MKHENSAHAVVAMRVMSEEVISIRSWVLRFLNPLDVRPASRVFIRFGFPANVWFLSSFSGTDFRKIEIRFSKESDYKICGLLPYVLVNTQQIACK
jgi:hypothetical protein